MILQVDRTHTPGTLMGGETVKTVGLLMAGFLGGNNITWPCKSLCRPSLSYRTHGTGIFTDTFGFNFDSLW